jgi:ABC-type multidrug transport system ATPase subunit
VTPLLELRSVSFRHWRGHRATAVLQDVSLELEVGEFGGVWADRSGGKTTLARLAAGVLVPDTGQVLLDGRDLSAPADSRRRVPVRADIGLATRTGPELEQITPEEWIASSLATSMSWHAALRRARLALNRLGVGEFARDRWQTLSDGERMLVAIAHATIRGPRLLVVDDPVAGLGPLSRAEILELLRSLTASGTAVLMTAADIVELAGLDRIWSLDDGHLNGSPPRPLGDVVPLRGTGA